MSLRRWFNRTFICSFWECKAKEELSWWRDGDDVVTIEPTLKKCERCGDPI